ncbi:transglycosylase SLT domain-containing protein [Methylobacterium fujisawaense]|uniref:transglycosylase SLT domain-containing protein n=1 Tax=Methylobacterium fujisawaense TaxID=107400 RepID=UPI0031F4D748
MPMSPEVAAAIQAAAERSGLSWSRPNYLPRVAQIESTGDPNARNGSAAGLFQFMPRTAKAFGLSNPYDPAEASDAAARLTATNERSLTKALGRAPTDGEMYLAHQQGSTGASKILANPGSTMGALGLGNAATGNGGSPDMLARDFASKWVGKVDHTPTAPAPTAPAGQPMTLPGASAAPGSLALNGPTQNGAAPSADGLSLPDAGSDLAGTLPRLAFGFGPLQSLRMP